MIRFIRYGATCPECGKRFHQIDTSEEHAFEVVTAAIENHLRDEHGIEADQ